MPTATINVRFRWKTGKHLLCVFRILTIRKSALIQQPICGGVVELTTLG
jgi:hypothetical protein